MQASKHEAHVARLAADAAEATAAKVAAVSQLRSRVTSLDGELTRTRLAHHKLKADHLEAMATAAAREHAVNELLQRSCGDGSGAALEGALDLRACIVPRCERTAAATALAPLSQVTLP